MPGALWVAMLITLAALLMGHAGGWDRPKVRARRLPHPTGRRWFVVWRGLMYGPYPSAAKAGDMAAELVTEAARTRTLVPGAPEGHGSRNGARR